MITGYKMKIFTILLLFTMSPLLYAATNDHNLSDVNFNPVISLDNDFLFVAEAGGKDPERPAGSGPLVLPEDSSDTKEKKCMKVCETWGEDCVINPRTGNRKCRKVCKLFGEECF